jgi:hypothetical protein
LTILHGNIQSLEDAILRITAVVFCACAFSCSSFADVFDSEKLDVSGFGRVVVGYLDDTNLTYNNYDNSFSIDEQSLFAVQADYQLSDSVTFATQLLAHSGETRDSGVEWLYLNYEPNQNWRFKVGRLRSPWFRFSDVIDVGFAYPWITPPQQVYSAFLFSNYDGLSATYRFVYNEIAIDIEGYFGVYNGDVFISGESFDLDVEPVRGLVLTANWLNFQFRASVFGSNDFSTRIPDVEQLAFLLDNAGFSNNADSLKFNGSANGYQFSFGYEDVTYSALLEYVKTPSDIELVPEVEAYYVHLGYQIQPFQLYANYAHSSNKYEFPANEVPVGISPQLDQLSLTYDAFINGLPQNSLDSYTFGVRWDVSTNMAFKTEVTFLRGEEGERSLFDTNIQSDPDRNATLYQFAWEWVF